MATPFANMASVGTEMRDSSSLPGIAFIDGTFVPVTEAKILILDWGFLRSDATYDVVHVWQGCFFRLDTRLDRFFPQ